MKIIEKLKTDRKLLLVVIGLIIATFLVPYLTIPGLILWWFYKKSKFSKKFKVTSTVVVGGLIVVLMTLGFIAYAKDVEPHLTISEPANPTSIKAQQITIKGIYDPIDRKVWVNGKQITASNGSFETIYRLNEGENKIEVTAGDWKRAKVSLVITRELTEEEKAARATPTPTPSPTSAPTQKPSKAPVVQKQATPTPTSTPKPSNRTKAKVVRVVDGDTMNFSFDGKTERIRVIGINTPETVDPRKSVECFGVEASNKAKEFLKVGAEVELEADPTQGERDTYQRLLRYVWFNSEDFGKKMIAEGYAYEYTYNTPYKYQLIYKQAQKEADANNRGLWADNACVAVATPKPATTTPGSSGTYTGNYSCSGPDRDCSDFSTHAQAQSFFNSCGFTATNDPMKLDSVGVGDGVACESLP